jgi:DNA adenine methylase
VTVTIRPPFTYYGGKMTIAARIAAALPQHGHYVEPFAGSLAILLAKRPSRMETVNDLDGAIVEFWRILRDEPAELARACALTPHSRAEWEMSRDLEQWWHEDLPAIERARRFWTAVTQARSNRLTA